MAAKRGVDVGGVEDGGFVDLAAEAPGGGEVDEDGVAGGAGGGEGWRWSRAARFDDLGFGLWRRGRERPMAIRTTAAMAEPQLAGHRPSAQPAMASMRKQASSQATRSTPSWGVELAVDPGEPDGGGEEGDGGELLEGFHPGAGAGEDAVQRGCQVRTR